MKILYRKDKNLKNEIYIMYLAYRDPRVSWYVKWFMLLIVAYFMSPIDLIPDFIPILGIVDDLIIVPVGVFLALRMIPQEVIDDCREKTRYEPMADRAKWIVTFIILLWLVVLYFLVKIIIRFFN